MKNGIGLFVAIILLAVLLPIALGIFFNQNTSSWDSDVVLIWNYLPIIAPIEIIIIFIVIYYRSKENTE